MLPYEEQSKRRREEGGAIGALVASAAMAVLAYMLLQVHPSAVAACSFLGFVLFLFGLVNGGMRLLKF